MGASHGGARWDTTHRLANTADQWSHDQQANQNSSTSNTSTNAAGNTIQPHDDLVHKRETGQAKTATVQFTKQEEAEGHKAWQCSRQVGEGEKTYQLP